MITYMSPSIWDREPLHGRQTKLSPPSVAVTESPAARIYVEIEVLEAYCGIIDEAVNILMNGTPTVQFSTDHGETWDNVCPDNNNPTPPDSEPIVKIGEHTPETIHQIRAAPRDDINQLLAEIENNE